MMMRARHMWMSPVQEQQSKVNHTLQDAVKKKYLVFSYPHFTYSSVQASMESPCSQILQLNQIYNPSTGWRSSLKWSRLCCLPQTKSRSLWAWWSRPGSTQIHRAQSSRSPCTSPQSCSSCLPWSWASRQRKGKSKLLSTGCGAPVCPKVPPQVLHADRNTHLNTHARGQTWFVYIITCFALNCDFAVLRRSLWWCVCCWYGTHKPTSMGAVLCTISLLHQMCRSLKMRTRQWHTHEKAYHILGTILFHTDDVGRRIIHLHLCERFGLRLYVMQNDCHE